MAVRVRRAAPGGKRPDVAGDEGDQGIPCADCGTPCVTANGWAMCPADTRHHVHADDGTVEGCAGCFAGEDEGTR